MFSAVAIKMNTFFSALLLSCIVAINCEVLWEASQSPDRNYLAAEQLMHLEFVFSMLKLTIFLIYTLRRPKQIIFFTHENGKFQPISVLLLALYIQGVLMKAQTSECVNEGGFGCVAQEDCAKSSDKADLCPAESVCCSKCNYYFVM